MIFPQKIKLVSNTMAWDSNTLLGDFLSPCFDLPTTLSDKDASLTINRMVLFAILLFAKTGSRDFFLLHGVSSTRATKKLLPLISDGETKANILRHLWRGLLATYVCQGLPNIFSRRASRPDLAALKQSPQQRWEKVVNVALRSTEEHIVKMVYSLKEEEGEYDSQTEEDKHLISQHLFLKTAEDMVENSGANGESFSFNGVGFGNLS